MNQVEYFNSLAQEWDVFCKHDTEKIRKILSFLKIETGDKVLDVGTGTGVLVPFLLEKVKESGEILAIDISEKMIEVAKRKLQASNLEFVNGDALSFDLKKDYYDHAVCYSMFPHFQDKRYAIDKLKEYLKVGGKIIICHSQSREAINNLHKNASDVVENDVLPTLEILEGYFIDSGYEVIERVDTDEMFVVIAKKK
ncbi:demethylmenaquinone methyltransferase / 2-methoxy-6-polyprenyl-1,4-benzoquinol methylase [Peptoniphilus asaccharolyticus DSM 20463]|uniref:Demethylmenaquinone methyltransferase / 2-methoxy-6-polyprenyl-1,4-benzoquinol methylase n=1 Tax=Peptoniphilus asaccharolyticus DSM 20463 TaxID=573058 RepID=A0A1W1V5Z6_PEPAS|nr:class I SAM-dependent methyltransferase [Peptoniphilus asaccharolyticus]MBL7576367.1 class I SAM-dependent methyltransferase [Peptoniphilus asaccharolyticus]SMB88600.1 demethylmenaquinone methyltransferase / 2-methoxy-6-polyprenyl-1,4-benzoquinol methylase [Peptoniphilus asaccharolyticus DSM 20463]